MRLTVCMLPDAERVTPEVEVAVVIDVLRATTVMATALANGAKSIATFQTTDAAKRYAKSLSRSPLLCGERHCRPIAGFDLGNSPAEYAAETVSGRSLAMTTTNGTRAVAAAQQAQRVVTASFLNAETAISAIASSQRVCLICAGTDGQITAEDVLLAGLLIDRCHQRVQNVELEGDEAFIAWNFWRYGADAAQSRDAITLADRLRQTQGGRNLVRRGFENDIDLCAQTDTIDFLPTQIRSSPPVFSEG